MADLDLTQLPNASLLHLTTFTSGNVVSVILRLLFALAGVLFLFYFLFGAAQWVMSGGDKEGLEKAGKTIRNALIGLCVVLFIYVIGGIAKNFFHVDLFNVCIPGATNPIYSCAPSNIGTNFGIQPSTTTGGGPPGIYACPCYNNLCSHPSVLANGGNGNCYVCTTSGWSATGTSTCGGVVIQCGTCN